ncbi:acyltransferase [Enterobacter sp. Bisph1]|uniref:acyltransferase family protein n=1 Tax=Enterobacter sp. Bisph1 TaxID=1274399 RepID=UPI00057BF0FC|nr:acyltransferase [Enterobacter sp. Bisph1]
MQQTTLRTNEKAAKEELYNLHFIRAISTIIIIIFHFYLIVDMVGIHEPLWPLFSKFGAIGVSYFLLLSGAVLFYHYQDIEIKPLGFYKKRIANLLPYFWVVYIFFAILFFFTRDRPFFELEVWRIIFSVTGLDGYLSSQIRTYYLVGEWFTGCIIIIYFIFPLLLKFYKKNKYLTLLFLVTLSYISISNNQYMQDHFMLWSKEFAWNPLVRLPEIATGGFIINLYMDKLIINLRKSFSIALVIFLAIITWACFSFSYDSLDILGHIPFMAASFILLMLTYDLFMRGKVTNRIVKYLSKYSFVAFLFHHQIIYIVVGRINLQHHNGFEHAFLCVAICITSFALARLVYSIGDMIKHVVFDKTLFKKIY